jgi:protein-S-isoprenylcysteine O-methyltransferase Ste14
VGVLLVVGIPPGVAWWFLIHPFVGFWRRLGARTALATVALSMISTMVLLAMVRDRLMGRDLGTDWRLVAVAAVLATAAVSIGTWRRRHLTTRVLAGMPELEGDAGNLLTEGPYAVLRHPRYVEVACAVFAYAAFSNHVGPWVVAVATLPALHLVVVLEERELRERFGAEYEAYRARVPRYLPRWGAAG